MPLAMLPIPEISISLASPEEPVSEPFSPFSPKGPYVEEDDTNWRATLLSPPPIISPRKLSPLRPADTPVKGQGIERERFEALLLTSRERNGVLGGKKSVDLRKEIAIKVHKSKQVERRALFLSKVQAPPSPTATLTPKTPPESPALFHYTLPSPGLDSPLAVFESLTRGQSSAPVREPWVEQVDFRLPGHPTPQCVPKSAPITGGRRLLPSLDQITAHLSSHGHVAAHGHEANTRSPRLPAFLQSGKRSPPQAMNTAFGVDITPIPKSRPAFSAAVGRLHFPARSAPTSESTKMANHKTPPCIPPESPTLLPPSKLQITTTLVPRTSSVSPTELTESNLHALNSREDTARKMLTRLRRRTLPPTTAVSEYAGDKLDDEQEQERKLRRRSAPPELPERARAGFSHPILSLPGAF
ncbi:hypothetical protein AcW1_000470 [Taiwanofungus camphoratus]|nr:hypothetical protein AcW1_000470 [Antrodia cinnamomea]